MLIRDISEYRTVFPISAETHYDNLLPSLIQGQGQLMEIMGVAEYTLLSTNYNAASLTPDQNEIIYMAQMVKVFYGLWKNLPELQVMISDMGNTELTDSAGTSAPVRLWAFNKLSDSLAAKVDEAADLLLKTMEAMPGSFPLWEASGSYTIYHDNFINSTEEFDKWANIGKSRTTWQRIRRYMVAAENKHIVSAICQDLFDEIKTQINTRSVTAPNQILLDMIQPAVASLCLIEAIPNINVTITESGVLARLGVFGEKKLKQAENTQVAELMKYHEGNAAFWINKLRTYLEDNLDTYPLYEASDCHSKNPLPNRLIDNTGRNSFFV